MHAASCAPHQGVATLVRLLLLDSLSCACTHAVMGFRSETPFLRTQGRAAVIPAGVFPLVVHMPSGMHAPQHLVRLCTCAVAPHHHIHACDSCWSGMYLLSVRQPGSVLRACTIARAGEGCVGVGACSRGAGWGAHLVRVCTLKVQSDHRAAAMGCSAPPSPLAASSSALRPSSASACAASYRGCAHGFGCKGFLQLSDLKK